MDQKAGSATDDLLRTPHSDALALSDREQLILQLWDQQEELRLESALIEAQNAVDSSILTDIPDNELAGQLTAAEKEVLEARATYAVRNKIIQNVIITDPVLKAVHAGSKTNLTERRLLPLIHERDILSMLHATMAADLAKSSKALFTTEQNNVSAMQKNKQLARAMLDLVEETKSQKVEEVQDPRIRDQLHTLDAEVRNVRRKWRVMKSVIAGMVVESGINWAQDDALRDLVMDDEDELG